MTQQAGGIVPSHDRESEMSGQKSAFMSVLATIGRVLPGDHARTFFYLNFIKAPRKVARNLLNNFYRMDHIYDVIGEFKANYAGKFSILEFGVAEGYTFRKLLFATRYLKMDSRIEVHGFDTFEGMPPSDDVRDRGIVPADSWVAGQFRSDDERLLRYCRSRYSNCHLHKGLFSESLTEQFLPELLEYPPILIWMDADYYTSTVSVFEKLIPYIPNGCVIYFDEPDFNYGSRFTGESRAIHEINSGQFGEGIELVLDRALSLDSLRVYRFINMNAKMMYSLSRPLASSDRLRPPTNDSPLP
jgi:hypothetical protein